MKRNFAATLIFLFSIFLYADNKEIMYTTAQSGLVVRKNSTKNSPVVGKLAYGTKVIIYEKSRHKDKIENITAYWYRIKYNKQYGWIFGGFLSKNKFSEFAILNNGLSTIKLGDSIKVLTGNSGFTLKKLLSSDEEGNKIEKRLVYDSSGVLFVISLDNDPVLNKVYEINVRSSKYKTSEGLGVGSSLSDFIKVYPDYSIWYTYVSERFVLETKKYKNIQFEISGYKKSKNKLGQTDMDILKKSDFSSKSKIESIRIY